VDSRAREHHQKRGHEVTRWRMEQVFLAERYPAIIARRGRGVISGLLSAGAERLKAIIREKPPMILVTTATPRLEEACRNRAKIGGCKH
jgi:hypothetical protein